MVVPRKRNWWLVLTLTLLTLVLLAAVIVWVAAARFAPAGRVARNVSVEGVAVGDMTREEALEAVTGQWLRNLPDTVVLSAAGDAWEASPEELGQVLLLDEAISDAMAVCHESALTTRLRSIWGAWRSGVQVQVRCAVDERRLRGCLVTLGPKVRREPQNATVDVVGERDVQVTPGVVGRNLSLDRSVAQAKMALASPRVQIIELAVETEEPDIKAEDLAHLETVLSSYTTKFNPGLVGRTRNLRKAAGLISKTALKPGDVFSFNTIVGPRLASTGWSRAKIYQNGEIVEDIGGGVCQVASTTYNAALLSNLAIVERHNHSLPVKYVPPSRDATVAYGQYDFQFRNSLANTILLLTSTGPNTLTVRILGAKADRYDVDLLVSGVSTIPHGVKEIPDPALAQGKRKVETPGSPGKTGTLTMVVKKDGVEIKRTVLHHDRYAPVTEKVRVGTKAPKEPEVAPEEELEPPPAGLGEPPSAAPTDVTP